MQRILSKMVVGLALLLVVSATAYAAPVSVDATSTFVDPIISPFDVFSIANTSGPGHQITDVIIDLGTSVGGAFFDTAPGFPGLLLSFPFTPDGGSVATGWSSVVGGADGSTLLSLSFTDFDPGEIFSFFIDVDVPFSPLVSGDHFSGATITALVTGSDLPLVGTYKKFLPFGAKADLDPVPEPGTWLLLSTGLVGLLGWSRKRLQRQVQ